ncbi:hypothetical protein [Streptomyces glaucus]
MTLSDATPHNYITDRLDRATAGPLVTVNSLEFAIGPEVTPAEVVQRATEVVSLSLPSLLEDLPDTGPTCADVLAVLTELVDVTARHQAGIDLVGKVAYDGAHVTVSVGDMARQLPPPEEEPGLYLVHRIAVDIGQYIGDNGGRVTWAAIEARR